MVSYPMNISLIVRALVLLGLVSFLGGCCNDKEIPKLTQNLYSGEPRERNDAALGLARCGDEAEGAVNRLAQLLYDENTGVQSAAAYALRQIDTESARAALERAENARRSAK